MWILVTQFSALTEAIYNTLAKKKTQGEKSYIVNWYVLLCQLPLLAVVMVFFGIPNVQIEFIPLLIVRLFFDSIALFLYFRALQISDVSKVTPLFSFSAVSTTIISYFFGLGDISFISLIGILIVVIGSYLLASENSISLKEGVREIQRDPGARYMLISAVLFGAVFSVSKPAANASSVSFYTFGAALGMFIIFTILAFRKSQNSFKFFGLIKIKSYAIFGILDGIKILLLILAISLTFPGFADATNNTAGIYSSFIAAFFFKEKIKSRILPSLIIALGVFLISVS